MSLAAERGPSPFPPVAVRTNGVYPLSLPYRLLPPVEGPRGRRLSLAGWLASKPDRLAVSARGD